MILDIPRQNVASLGVIGGSGFYRWLEDVDELPVETPFGPPSDSISVGELEGVRVAFLPRHGRGHQYPPHAINYRANLWALASLGVERIVAPSAGGSLQLRVKPGDFVICDQFIDRTAGRRDTFYDGPTAVHVSTADPYCPELRSLAAQSARALGIPVHERGSVVVVQGPRFSTRAESLWFASQGWEVVNMTQYPEVALARELALCYVNVSLITDWDVGVEGDPDIRAVSVEGVLRVLNANNERLRELLSHLAPRVPSQRGCSCPAALEGAVVG